MPEYSFRRQYLGLTRLFPSYKTLLPWLATSLTFFQGNQYWKYDIVALGVSGGHV
jgi:hypothetical protein